MFRISYFLDNKYRASVSSTHTALVHRAIKWINYARINYGARAPGPPTFRGPHKNDHVLKTMNQNSVKLRPVLLLPKANISLWGNPAVTAVRPVPPVPDNRSDETSIVISSGNTLTIYLMLCFRCLRQVKVTRMYVIISINYCLLIDMMVMSISYMG